MKLFLSLMILISYSGFANAEQFIAQSLLSNKAGELRVSQTIASIVLKEAGLLPEDNMRWPDLKTMMVSYEKKTGKAMPEVAQDGYKKLADEKNAQLKGAWIQLKDKDPKEAGSYRSPRSSSEYKLKKINSEVFQPLGGKRNEISAGR